MNLRCDEKLWDAKDEGQAGEDARDPKEIRQRCHEDENSKRRLIP
jgi:hypothetical protein